MHLPSNRYDIKGQDTFRLANQPNKSHCTSYRYLTEEVYKKPVIVYNYPKDIKAFYMRLNDDGKTVAAMDVLVPKVCTSIIYYEAS